VAIAAARGFRDVVALIDRAIEARRPLALVWLGLASCRAHAQPLPPIPPYASAQPAEARAAAWRGGPGRRDKNHFK
jgi:hypothetical protein